MGRPLYATLIATHRVTAQVATQPLPSSDNIAARSPVIEKWSRWNAFDPDSDEFFQAEDAVYEAFLTEEEVVARDEALQYERLTARRGMDALVHPDIPSDGRPNARVWSDEQLVASPRTMSYVFDGTEASSGSQSTTSLDSITREITNVRTGPPVLFQNPAPINRSLEEHSQSAALTLPLSLNASPIPNTPARISGFFSSRRTYVGLGSLVEHPVSPRIDIGISHATEPLTS